GASKRTSSAATWCRGNWTFAHLAVVSLLVVGAVLATSNAWRDIYVIADKDDEHSHAYLVPVVAAWLFWVRRERLRGYQPSATWVGPVLVALGWAMNSIGETYFIQSFWHG